MTDRDLQQKRYIAAGIDIAVAIAVGIVFAIVGMVLGFAFSSSNSTSMVGVYLPRVISFLGSLVSLGYILGQKYPKLGDYLDIIIPAIIVLSLIPIAVEFIRHRRGASVETADEPA